MKCFRSFWFAAFLRFPMLYGAIEIDGFDTNQHDRYRNNGSFIASGYDLSGVALDSSARWVTMVSDQVFVSAYHFAPVNGQNIRFLEGNDPAQPSILRTIAGGQRIGTSDLWVGHLNAPLPGTIAQYGYMSQTITNGAQFSTHLGGTTALMMGRSPTDHTTFGTHGVTMDQAYGINVLDSYADDFTSGSVTQDMIIAIDNNPGDVNYVSTHEAQAKPGDSGGALFRDNGGQLEIVGINWVSAPGTFGIGERGFTGFTYVGNFATEIGDYIVAIPESGSFLLVCLAGFVSLLGICRGSRAIKTSRLRAEQR